MKKFDAKNPHYGACVAKAMAIERQKAIVSRLEAELDAEIERQDLLAVEREAAIKELEKKKAAAKKVKK